MSMIGHNDYFQHGNDYYKFEIVGQKQEKLNPLDKRQREALQVEMGLLLKYVTGNQEFQRIFGSAPSELTIQQHQDQHKTTFVQGAKYLTGASEKGEINLLMRDVAKKNGIVGDFALRLVKINQKEAERMEAVQSGARFNPTTPADIKQMEESLKRAGKTVGPRAPEQPTVSKERPSLARTVATRNLNAAQAKRLSKEVDNSANRTKRNSGDLTKQLASLAKDASNKAVAKAANNAGKESEKVGKAAVAVTSATTLPKKARAHDDMRRQVMRLSQGVGQLKAEEPPHDEFEAIEALAQKTIDDLALEKGWAEIDDIIKGDK